MSLDLRNYPGAHRLQTGSPIINACRRPVTDLVFSGLVGESKNIPPSTESSAERSCRPKSFPQVSPNAQAVLGEDISFFLPILSTNKDDRFAYCEAFSKRLEQPLSLFELTPQDSFLLLSSLARFKVVIPFIPELLEKATQHFSFNAHDSVRSDYLLAILSVANEFDPAFPGLSERVDGWLRQTLPEQPFKLSYQAKLLPWLAQFVALYSRDDCNNKNLPRNILARWAEEVFSEPRAYREYKFPMANK